MYEVYFFIQRHKKGNYAFSEVQKKEPGSDY